MRETEDHLGKNVIKAKYLSAKILRLNKQLGETLKEISKDNVKISSLREATSRKQ